jgi:hypothetical protein
MIAITIAFPQMVMHYRGVPRGDPADVEIRLPGFGAPSAAPVFPAAPGLQAPPSFAPSGGALSQPPSFGQPQPAPTPPTVSQPPSFAPQ